MYTTFSVQRSIYQLENSEPIETVIMGVPTGLNLIKDAYLSFLFISPYLKEITNCVTSQASFSGKLQGYGVAIVVLTRSMDINLPSGSLLVDFENTPNERKPTRNKMIKV